MLHDDGNGSTGCTEEKWECVVTDGGVADNGVVTRFEGKVEVGLFLRKEGFVNRAFV